MNNNKILLKFIVLINIVVSTLFIYIAVSITIVNINKQSDAKILNEFISEYNLFINAFNKNELDSASSSLNNCKELSLKFDFVNVDYLRQEIQYQVDNLDKNEDIVSSKNKVNLKIKELLYILNES